MAMSSASASQSLKVPLTACCLLEGGASVTCDDNARDDFTSSKITASVQKMTKVVCVALLAMAVVLEIVAIRGELSTPPPATMLTADPPPFANTSTPTITELIEDTDVLYKTYGIANVPVFAATAKGFFNYAVQTGLLVGPEWRRGGKVAAIERMKGQSITFGRLSQVFQVVGQLSAVTSYWLLAHHTRCWAGQQQWEIFSLLVSQHSSSTSVIVGVANNAVVRYFAEDTASSRAAHVLFYTGLAAGAPLWAVVVTTQCSWGGLLVLPLVVMFLLFWAACQEGKPGVLTEDFALFFGLASSVLILEWLVLGFCCSPPGSIGVKWDSILLTGAVVVEMVLPAFTLWISLASLLVPGHRKCVGDLLGHAFLTALMGSVLLSLAVPTNLLTHHGYFASAAPTVFAGKKIIKYFTYTMIRPAIAEAGHASGIFHIWASEFFSWFA